MDQAIKVGHEKPTRRVMNVEHTSSIHRPSGLIGL